jgi:hypothetical protein
MKVANMTDFCFLTIRNTQGKTFTRLEKLLLTFEYIKAVYDDMPTQTI